MTVSSPVETATNTQPPTSPDVESVSVVIPCRNEERFIGHALERLAEQYDHDRYEIVVVDGFSEDGTRAVIEQFQRDHPDLKIQLLDNPARNIPTGLNLGVKAATGEIIARMDAHAAPPAGYIRRLVEVLRQERAGAAGMPCLVRPARDTVTATAIAGAVSHPFGIGDAKYRLTEGGPLQEPVDTVAFACFRKSLWEELGGFDETLLTNEDYDFNYRVRRSGRDVILDRTAHCDYFARGNLKALAKQYFRYGGWKAEMIRRQPRSIRLRHLVAPIFVLSLIGLAIAGFFWPLAWWFLLFELALYLLLALAAGAQVAKRTNAGVRMMLLMPLIFLTIHLTWGSSFLLRLAGLRT